MTKIEIEISCQKIRQDVFNNAKFAGIYGGGTSNSGGVTSNSGGRHFPRTFGNFDVSSHFRINMSDKINA